jgi:hypothetical protein
MSKQAWAVTSMLALVSCGGELGQQGTGASDAGSVSAGPDGGTSSGGGSGSSGSGSSGSGSSGGGSRDAGMGGAPTGPCLDPSGSCQNTSTTEHNFDGVCEGEPPACPAGELCLMPPPGEGGGDKCIPMPSACLGLGTNTCACLGNFPEPSNCQCEDNANSQAALLCW